MFVARLNKANALLDIVIIQERDKETSGVAMRTQDIGLGLLAERIHTNQVGRWRGGLYDGFKIEEQWIIECCVHSDKLALIACRPANEPGNLLFGRDQAKALQVAAQEADKLRAEAQAEAGAST